MKLLITGSSGFLGRRAAAHFSSLGCEVLTPSHAQLDITKEEDVLRWFSANRPDAVLHCAAISDTGLCQREPERTQIINVDGSLHLAAACAETTAKLVLCSSDQVYAGSPLPGPHTETEPLIPGNVYARQKSLAEQQCAALCPNTVSLRLSWMYATQSCPGEHGHFLATLLHSLQDETLPITWPIHDFRGITNVAEVVGNLPAALALPAGVYNFGAENDSDTFHMVESVLKALNLTNALARLVPNTQAFADAPRDIRMDTGKAQAAGIQFKTTTDGLCSALNSVISKKGAVL